MRYLLFLALSQLRHRRVSLDVRLLSSLVQERAVASTSGFCVSAGAWRTLQLSWVFREPAYTLFDASRKRYYLGLDVRLREFKNSRNLFLRLRSTKLSRVRVVGGIRARACVFQPVIGFSLYGFRDFGVWSNSGVSAAPWVFDSSYSSPFYRGCGRSTLCWGGFFSRTVLLALAVFVYQFKPQLTLAAAGLEEGKLQLSEFDLVTGSSATLPDLSLEETLALRFSSLAAGRLNLPPRLFVPSDSRREHLIFSLSGGLEEVTIPVDRALVADLRPLPVSLRQWAPTFSPQRAAAMWVCPDDASFMSPEYPAVVSFFTLSGKVFAPFHVSGVLGFVPRARKRLMTLTFLL